MLALSMLGYSKPLVVKGSGKVVKENREVGSFSRIVISDAIQVVITPGDVESVTVEAEDNILPLVTIETGGDKLNIKMKEMQSITTDIGVKVYVTYKQLAELFVSGASRLSATGTVKGEKLLLILSGASQADLDVQLQWLSVNCSDASKGVISGNTEKLNIQCSSASNLNAQKLASKEADADASGASNITLQTKNKLNIMASGASVVRYQCDPTTVISRDISGASTVTALNGD
jgi:hypothetical protein